MERGGQAEAIITPEIQGSRRTDDILFNVYYLRANMINARTREFDPVADADVLEQDRTEITEADMHALGAKVRQHRDNDTGQYWSLGSGTVDHAIKGIESVDTTDEKNLFEFFRRVEEVTDEEIPLRPHVNVQMRAGAIRVFASPPPTPGEADPDVAGAWDYDGRTMLRFQSLSSDGGRKDMLSFSLFDAPADAWAELIKDWWKVEIEPTALAVMQFFNQLEVVKGPITKALEFLVKGVAEYVGLDEHDNLMRQLEDFQTKQAELEQRADYYAKQKRDFEKELAVSLGGRATPMVEAVIRDAYPHLSKEHQATIAQAWPTGFKGMLRVDEDVAKIAISYKTVTLDNRAGLAAMNYLTVKRVAHTIGFDETVAMIERERWIMEQNQMGIDSEFIARRNDRLIAEAGLECGGGCSVSIVDLFSKDALTARRAGLEGTLYSSESLDKGSKCNCGKNKARVISNGKQVICTRCETYTDKNGNTRTLRK